MTNMVFLGTTRSMASVISFTMMSWTMSTSSCWKTAASFSALIAQQILASRDLKFLQVTSLRVLLLSCVSKEAEMGLWSVAA